MAPDGWVVGVVVDTEGVGTGAVGGATVVGVPVAVPAEAEAPGTTVCTDGTEGAEGARLCLALFELPFDPVLPPASCPP